jgi:glycosyltransferase involved in cell wall biosynthesis
VVLSASGHGTGRTAVWAIPVGDRGGVGRHAIDVASSGIPGWRTEFLVPDGPVVAALRASGASVRVADFGPAHGLRSSASALRHAVADFRPSVVHTHLSYADVVGALVKPHGTALVTTEHGLADDDLVYHGSRARSQVRGLMHRARVRRADSLIAVSDATLRVARRKWHLPERLPTHVLHNGIDRPAPLPEARPGLHVVSLARLAPEKRLPELVAAFALVAADHPDARLTLAGTGPLEDDLRSQVTRLGLDGRVSFPGFVEAAVLLGQAHVLALLSVWENCSYALLDALAHRVGVVASPVGANPEMVPADCLVDPADSRAVAAAILRQGLDVGTRPELSADWPDVAAMTDQVARVYAEVDR